MGKADLAPIHGVGAARHLGEALTHRKPVVGRIGGHPAVEADPIPRAVKAFVVPPVGLVELGGELRELELELVDDPAQADQLMGDFLAREDHFNHAFIVSNIGTTGKLIYTHSSSPRRARSLQAFPPPPSSPPSSRRESGSAAFSLRRPRLRKLL